MSNKTKDNFDKMDFQPETPQLRNVSGSSTESRGSARDSGYGGSGYGDSPKDKKHPEVKKNSEEISLLFLNFVLDLSVNPSDWKNTFGEFKDRYQEIEEKITNHTNANNRFSWNSLDRKLWDYQNILNRTEDSYTIDSLIMNSQQQEMREGIAFRMIISCGNDAIFNLDLFNVLTSGYISDYEVETSPKISDVKSLLSATDEFSNSSLHLLAIRIAEKIRNGDGLSSCWNVYKEFSKHFTEELENNFQNSFEQTPTSIVESEGVGIEQTVQFVS